MLHIIVMYVTAKPCSHPLSSDQADSINVTGITLTNPITEGTTAIFSCPLRQVLTGPNVSICMENGEWIPDTKEVQCVKGKFNIIIIIFIKIMIDMIVLVCLVIVL
jgi:hypothetical protein